MEGKRNPDPPMAWQFVPLGEEPRWNDAPPAPNKPTLVVDATALAFAALGAALLLASIVVL